MYKSFWKYKIGLQNIWTALCWGYLYAVTQHMCIIQDVNNCATRGLRDSCNFWKMKGTALLNQFFSFRKIFPTEIEKSTKIMILMGVE